MLRLEPVETEYTKLTVAEKFATDWQLQIDKGRTEEDAFRLVEHRYKPELDKLLKSFSNYTDFNMSVTPENFMQVWSRHIAEHKELRTIKRRRG